MTGIIKHAVASDREGNCSVIIDFMSKIRSFPNLATFVTFKRAIGGSLNLFLDKHPHCFDSYLLKLGKGCAALVELAQLTSLS